MIKDLLVEQLLLTCSVVRLVCGSLIIHFCRTVYTSFNHISGSGHAERTVGETQVIFIVFYWVQAFYFSGDS